MLSRETAPATVAVNVMELLGRCRYVEEDGGNARGMYIADAGKTPRSPRCR
jgi:hypothetical protein